MHNLKILFISTLFPAMLWAQEPIYGNSTNPYVEAGFFTRITSLTTPENIAEACPTIAQTINPVDGYYIEHEKSYSGSFQSAHGWWFPSLEQWAAVGVGPKANHYVIFFGKSFGEDAVKEFKKRKLPLKKSELDSWNEDDAVFWNSEGGAVLGLGTGRSPIHVGTTFNIRGSWAHYVQKTGPNKVFVSMINRSVKSVSVSAGILYMGSGLDYVLDKVRSRSYEIDIIDEAHEVAYRKFLKGDETDLIALKEQGSNSITPIEVIQGRKIARDMAVGIANPIFPIFSWRISNSRYNQNEHGEASWGTLRDKFWGGYSWQKKYKALHLDFRRFKQFSAGTQVRLDPDYSNGGQIEVKSHFAKLEYIFESDHGRENRLQNQFDNFVKTTGLTHYCIKVPDYKKSLRYHAISHEINFSDEFVKRLIDLAYSKELISKLQDFAQNQNIDSNIEKLEDSVEDLSVSEFNSEDMAKAFSKIGKKITSHPQLYRLFYEIGKSCGMEVSFEVSGQRIPKYRKTESYAFSEDCLN